MATLTRELIYDVRRALRLGYNTPEQRRSCRLPASVWNKTFAMERVKAHVSLPRGTTKAVEQVILQLLPYREPVPVSLAQRRRAFILATYRQEIRRRGGEIRIRSRSGTAELGLQDEENGLFLLKADGWRHYSRRFGARPANLCYLCGRDDNGKWATRVFGTCNTVEDALRMLEPTAVRKARENGKVVLRQGDVYVVESLTRYDGKGAAELPSNHTWDKEARVLRHDSHNVLAVPFPCRFYTQSALGMGRTNTRGRGD